MMDYKYSTRKRMKDKPLMSKRNSVGAELHHLDEDKSITTDPGENNKRRTLLLKKIKNSWGFTLQTYGIKHKKTNEIEIMTYVDYVEMNGAAWMAGMRRGDVIISVNGEKVGEKSHQQLVDKIRKGGEIMRMVVLFEDCCRKVDLHEKYIRLKGVLKSKYQELKEIEQEEMQILDRYYEAKGLNRFEQIRQSILSNNSSSNDSWDAYSMISSPNGMLSTGHFAHNQWTSATSLKSFSVGDSSSMYDGDYSYMDSEVESDEICNQDNPCNLNKSDSYIARNGTGTLTPSGMNAAKLRMSRASDSVLYKQSKTISPSGRNKSKTSSLVGSTECIIDDVFAEEDDASEAKVQDLTSQKDKVFYAGENGNIIVPKICVEGENMYTTLDAIDSTTYQDQIVAMEIAKEMARLDKIELDNKTREAGLPKVEVTESKGTSVPDKWTSAGSRDISSNGAKNEILTKEINGARSKYSNNEFTLPWKHSPERGSDSALAKGSPKGTPSDSPKTERNMFPGIGGSMSYENLKSSIPDIRISFHTDDCQVIYINEKDEITKL